MTPDEKIKAVGSDDADHIAMENRYHELRQAEARLRAFLTSVTVLQDRQDLFMDEHARNRLRTMRQDFQKTGGEFDELLHRWGVFNE